MNCEGGWVYIVILLFHGHGRSAVGFVFIAGGGIPRSASVPDLNQCPLVDSLIDSLIALNPANHNDYLRTDNLWQR